VLIIECMLRLSSARLVALSNADNTGGIKATALPGTVTVTGGSASVVGSGTNFVTGGLQGLVETFGGIVIQFASQPGRNYVVASVQSDTALTLYSAYAGVTAASVGAVLPSINYQALQQAVFDAQAEFQDATDLVYDDVTQSTSTPGSNPTLNRDVWAGVALVVAYLYDPGRGNPWPEAEVEAAWRLARKRLDMVLHNRGDGAWAAPYTDSVFTPSVGPARLPSTDTERWGDISILSPGPSDASPAGGGVEGDWGW